MLENSDPLDQTMDTLNREFYREYGPAEYLFMRLNLLCVVGGAFGPLKEIIAGGVEFETIRLKLPEADHSDVNSAQSDDPIRDHFLRIEAHHLKHLAIETLLRLFLGHKGLPQCPWVEMSKVTKFKDTVEHEIVDTDTDDLQADVRQIILGLPRSRESLTDTQRDLSHNMAEILRMFAKDWLDEAKSYNATKHGLTAVPGAAEFSLGPQGGEQINIASGDSLVHLVHSTWSNNERQWSRTTRWITIEYAVTTVFIVHNMIESLWHVARARYGVSEDRNSVLWWPSASFSIDDLLRLRDGAAEISWSIFEEYRR